LGGIVRSSIDQYERGEYKNFSRKCLGDLKERMEIKSSRLKTNLRRSRFCYQIPPEWKHEIEGEKTRAQSKSNEDKCPHLKRGFIQMGGRIAI